MMLLQMSIVLIDISLKQSKGDLAKFTDNLEDFSEF